LIRCHARLSSIGIKVIPNALVAFPENIALAFVSVDLSEKGVLYRNGKFHGNWCPFNNNNNKGGNKGTPLTPPNKRYYSTLLIVCQAFSLVVPNHKGKDAVNTGEKGETKHTS